MLESILIKALAAALTAWCVVRVVGAAWSPMPSKVTAPRSTRQGR